MTSLSTIAVLAHDAAVAVRHVLAEADVGDHDQRRLGLLERAHRELDDALGVVGAGGGVVLVGRDPEQQHGGDPERRDLLSLLVEVGDREPLDSGHRVDRLAPVASVGDEQRIDEVLDRQLGLTHEAAQGAGLPHPPQSRGGERTSRASLREAPQRQPAGKRRMQP